MYKTSAFIGGKPIVKSEVIEVISPIDNKVVGSFPILNEQEVQQAFDYANLAFINWSQVDYQTRVKYILAYAAKIKEHSAAIANIIHLEIGKGLKSALDEVNRSYEYIVESAHAYADMMDNLEEYNHDNNILIPKDFHATYVRIPLGVALTISPFNYPVNLMITKIVPAILTGNTVVHKSATNGSISGWYLAKLFHEVTVDGYLITEGVFNYITGKGSDLGKWFNKEKKISSFSFTGSSNVGKAVTENLPSCIAIQLELGGHNPAVVMDSADLDLAVSEIIKGAFGFSGQRCTSIKRVLVHYRVHDAFIEKLKKALSKVKLEEPLINSRSVKQLEECYRDSLDKGAIRVSDELKINGNFVTPVVLSKVRKGMRVYEEEIFAPLIAISNYEKEEDIISFCNDSKYGLQASVFGKDIDYITQFSLKLEFSRVNINLAPARSPDVLPFGGLKNSGFGLQSIGESLRFFTNRKGIVLKQKSE